MSDMQLIGLGFGSYIAADKIVTVLTPDSAPIKRMISDGRERGLLIDASFGRSTKSVLLMNSSHIVLSSLSPDVLYREIQEYMPSDSKGGIASWKTEEN